MIPLLRNFAYARFATKKKTTEEFMKKFLKLTTVVVSMVMALAFVSCANGNENGQLNLVGTYGLSKVEGIEKDSNGEALMTITVTKPTSTSIRQYSTNKVIDGETTTVTEMDFTVTKTENGYSFKWAKFNIDGVAQGDEVKTQQEEQYANGKWDHYTAMFAITYTTTADGTWSDNSDPASSGTYTVDEANSKVTMTTLIEGGNTLNPPVNEELTYSDNGKTFVFVKEGSSDKGTNKMTMTLTRK